MTRVSTTAVAGLLFAAMTAASGCSTTVADGGASSSGATSTTPEAPTSRATGALTAWNALPALPVARGNHCSVVANGYLVVIGGNHKPKGAKDFVTVADVHVAKLDADGNAGQWKLAGKLASPVSSCTAATDGKDVYVVDGIFDDAAVSADPKKNTVLRASLADDGTLGAWTEMGALPDGVRILYSDATVEGGALRAFFARLPDNGDGIALATAPVENGATLGAWQSSTWLPGFRGHPQYALAKPEGAKGASYIYALGGYASGDKGNAVLADGAGAALDLEGVPGKSFPVRALPKPTSFGKAVAIDDWLFVIGGKDEVLTGKGRSDVFAAHIEAGGALGEWKVVAAMPEGRTSHAVAAHGDLVYVTGGGFDAGGLDTVWSARVRTAPPAR